MKQKLTYRIAARTQAAGKYDPTASREGNEDSMGILCDVGNPDASFTPDAILPLPEHGVLMVVADGMGGHNAGEVASQIAVDTVRDLFAPEEIKDKDFSTPQARAHYLEEVVVAADNNIRADEASHPDRKGMGSTIVMAWAVGNELTVTWCGDSRAYRYRPESEPELEMLSEDHSLVQDMVRQGRMTYEMTFNHPQGNVITRSLGGGGKGHAMPESRQFSLEIGDVIMLCSDGLSGVLFDDGRINPHTSEPYSEENIRDILARNNKQLTDTLSELFDAAERSDWYDNVTAILFEFKPGAKSRHSKRFHSHSKGSASSPSASDGSEETGKTQVETVNKERRFLTSLKKLPRWAWFLIGALLVVIVWWLMNLFSKPSETIVDPLDTAHGKVESTIEKKAFKKTENVVKKELDTLEKKNTSYC